MKNFFKTFGAALLAFIAGTFLMWMIVMGLFAGMISSFGHKQVAIPPEAVLVIDLADGIVDSPENTFSGFNMRSRRVSKAQTTLEVINALQMAAADPAIKGIFINVSGAGSVNYANVEELRDQLVRFREESGKFIVAYNEAYTQGSYWLSSVADKVFMNPEGFMDWRGVAANVMFYKGLLDKLDVDVEVVRHGTFKAAVEPYITDKMSPANRLQVTTLVNSLWGVITGDVSSARNIPVAKLMEYAEQMSIGSPQDALRLGLVDGLLYRDQVDGVMAEMIRGRSVTDYETVEDNAQVNSVSLSDYISAHPVMNTRISRNKIAVIYAEGEIVDGDSYPEAIGGRTLSDQIAEARMDKGVKALVLRVNSPGGSALASEVVWREMELCRKEKPVIVSMGGMAASGGYYISVPADVIFADRTTQTGSIGVFGMMLNLERTLRDKLGITVDVVKTNPSADMGSIARPLSSAERAFLQNQVEKTYRTFVNHVAEGRNMTFNEVDEIGQGRVWLGVDAKEKGLIDGFGGLYDAIALAADRAGVADDFRIYQILSEPDSFTALLSMFSARIKASCIRGQVGEAFADYNSLMNALEEEGIMARMPYNINFME